MLGKTFVRQWKEIKIGKKKRRLGKMIVVVIRE